MSKRKHSKEFRDQAVKQTLESEETIREIAAKLGINYWTLREWRKEYLASQKEAPPSTTPVNVKAEIKKLKEENANLRIALCQ